MGAFTGMAPIMPAILNTLMGEAQLQHEQLSNELEGLEIQQVQQRNRDQKITQDVLGQFLAGGSSSSDKSLIPSDSDTPVTAAMKSAKMAYSQASQADQLANQIQAAGASPGVVEYWKDKASDARQKANVLQKEWAKEQKDLNNEIGDIAMFGAEDEANIPEAFHRLQALDPVRANKLNMDRDANGNPVAGPNSKMSMNSLVAGTVSAKDRMNFDEKVRAHKEAEEARTAAAEERKRENAQRDADRAVQQSGVQAQREATNEAKRETREQRALSQAQTVQNEYKNDKQVQEFAEQRKQFEKAYNYVYDPATGKPKSEGPVGTSGWANHDSAQDYQLAQQYIAFVHPGYAGRLNDYKTLTQQLPNLPEKLAHAIVGVATGKGILAQSDRVNMVNAMKGALMTENDAQIEREDEALGRIRNIDKNGETIADPSIYVHKYAIRPDQGSKAAPTSGSADPIARAREVIAKGANRDAVIQKLKAAGIDTSGL